MCVNNSDTMIRNQKRVNVWKGIMKKILSVLHVLNFMDSVLIIALPILKSI